MRHFEHLGPNVAASRFPLSPVPPNQASIDAPEVAWVGLLSRVVSEVQACI